MPQFEPQHTPRNINPVARGFLDCAEWLLDEGTDRDTIKGWAPSAIRFAVEECDDFVQYNPEDYEAYCERCGVDADERFGHDFFLTRNHHGAGFWDRGLDDLGNRLTKAAHTFGFADVYLGDDGFLYCFRRQFSRHFT